VLVIVVYELLIKRISPMRFLFGMRLRKKQPAAPAPRPGGSAA
jgi:hypothetical protein